MTEVAPSIFAGDLSTVADELAEIRTADRIHVDVMDGHFVPNLALGFHFVGCVRNATSLPLDIHLMVSNPLDHVDRLESLPADSVTVHVEALSGVVELQRLMLSDVPSIGLAVNPETNLDTVTEFLDDVPRITVMGVEPGFSGREFRTEVLAKIERLNELYDGLIEIDGGVTVEIAGKSVAAGADIVVSGSAIFGSENRQEKIEALRIAPQ